ncbi:cold shock domain-containing protein [Aggregatilinea lenta]|uniref:cold shock domain-containing protein n=1 Tax=Aggregatilinea lenta TaxID=913108 RepID=UPI000E5A1DB7|nr:cold shock domain-containing protein [Aggregatilinea lenta]
MAAIIDTNRYEGTVKAYSTAEGTGIIEMLDGREATVRYSSIRGEGVRRLHRGAPVTFQLQETRRGLYAVCVQQD